MEKKRRDWTPILIEIAIVLAVMPRWIPALMLSEGFTIPENWLGWWIPMSALFNAGMAVTEAVAIAYVIAAWSRARGTDARRLLILTTLMVVTFSFVLMPYIASSVVGVEMQVILSDPSQYWIVLFWGTAVVLSTGFAVMAVGLAQARIKDSESETSDIYCWCGYKAQDEKDLEDHTYIHGDEVIEYDSSVDALQALRDRYDNNRREILPNFPKVHEITMIRNQYKDEVKEV